MWSAVGASGRPFEHHSPAVVVWCIRMVDASWLQLMVCTGGLLLSRVTCCYFFQGTVPPRMLLHSQHPVPHGTSFPLGGGVNCYYLHFGAALWWLRRHRGMKAQAPTTPRCLQGRDCAGVALRRMACCDLS